MKQNIFLLSVALGLLASSLSTEASYLVTAVSKQDLTDILRGKANPNVLATVQNQIQQQAQAKEILDVASVVMASQRAAQLAQSKEKLKLQDRSMRKCIAFEYPSMAFICTCQKHILNYSSYNKNLPTK